MRSPLQTIGGASGARDGVVYHRSEAMGGRLSLTSGLDVTTSDVTAATALFYTESQSNLVTLPWRPGKWEAFELPRTPAGVYEVRADFLANSPWALATGAPYDVFLALGQDGPKLVRGPAWSSATARAAALDRSEGRRVLGINPLWVYVGTIYASATNQCEDSATKRFVWNMYNRVVRRLYKWTNASHTYNVAAYRQYGADATQQVEFVLGLAEQIMPVDVLMQIIAAAAGHTGYATVGLDTTSAISIDTNAINQTTSTFNIPTIGKLSPSIGYHYIAILEYGEVASPPTFASPLVRSEIWG